MFVEEILKSPSNTVVEGMYLFLDAKLKPYNEREGHFLTFSLQDKTGLVWAKIWDNAEYIVQQLQDVSVVTIKGRTNIYNNKTQVIVDKIKVAEEGSYDLKDLVKMVVGDPDAMWIELCSILAKHLRNEEIKAIWKHFTFNEFSDQFRLWPGGKGTVHHAYQHGLLEHTLSVVKLIVQFSHLSFDLDKALLGAALHDIGKIKSYAYDKVKTEMTDIGRLHGHTVLGYFEFRKMVENVQKETKLYHAEQFIDEIGHIILSHHGSKESQAIILPMTIEAKLVAIADAMDAEVNHMTLQLQHNADDKGWVFDTLHSQFYYRKPMMKRRKLQ